MNQATSRLHIGIIPDGSRRWARRVGKPQDWDGNESGLKVEEILSHITDNCPQVDEVTIWALSTENFRRSDHDRQKVFSIVAGLIARTEVFERARARLRFVGSRLDEVPDFLRSAIATAETLTRDFDRMKLNVGLGYGGREEILQAVGRMLRERDCGDGAAPPSAGEFERGLMVPRPLDIIIRTGGEQRLSGFMLYQAEYAELFFTPTLWPDFSTGEFDAILGQFGRRERRFGR